MSYELENSHYKSYAIATHTTTTTQQIILLYDHTIRCLQQAREAMAGDQIEKRYNALTKASELVMGLQSCIDFNHDHTIATLLYDFYASIDGRIHDIHRSLSLDHCDSTIEELQKMREIWQGIDQAQYSKTINPAEDMPGSALSGNKNVTLSA
jgi:flagellar biosynthetic protein FliS